MKFRYNKKIMFGLAIICAAILARSPGVMATDYSGVFFITITGDASMTGYMKIEQTGSDVEMVLDWERYPWTGTTCRNP